MYLRRTTLTIFVFLFSASCLLSNGISLNSVGPRALGMGGAYTAIADDYSAIYWNPAGATQLKGAQVAVYVTDIVPMPTYKFDHPLGSIDASGNIKHYIGPNIAGYMPFMEGDLSIGLSAYVPAGLGTDWKNSELVALNQPGKTDLHWSSQIAVINFSPVIAYKLCDMLSLGAAANIYYGMFEMDRPMDMIDMTIPGSGEDHMMETQYTEDGDGLGVSFSFGAMIKPIEDLSVGLSFKTQNTVSFTGTAKNPTIAAGGQPLESDYERDLAWPMWFSAGLAYKLTDRLLIAFDAQFSQWSESMKELETTYKDWVDQSGNTAVEKMEMGWEDCWQLRFGAEFMLTPDWALRCGYYHDPAPAPDETLNILFPSITYNAITLGTGYRFGQFLADLSMEYMIGGEREIDPAKGYADAMPGTHNMNIFAASVGLSYCFCR